MGRIALSRDISRVFCGVRVREEGVSSGFGRFFFEVLSEFELCFGGTWWWVLGIW